MFPSVYSGAGCDYPVITRTAPNKELRGFSPALLNYRTSAANWAEKKSFSGPSSPAPPALQGGAGSSCIATRVRGPAAALAPRLPPKQGEGLLYTTTTTTTPAQTHTQSRGCRASRCHV